VGFEYRLREWRSRGHDRAYGVFAERDWTRGSSSRASARSALSDNATVLFASAAKPAKQAWFKPTATVYNLIRITTR
jgi:hypothetical protein